MDNSSQRSKSISLSTVTRLTEAALGVGCLSLHTRPIIVQPNLYCSAQGSSSFPKMTLIDWKAAGTFRPMSRPISTSGGAVSCPQCEINVFTGLLIGVWRCPHVKRGCTLVSTQTELRQVHNSFLLKRQSSYFLGSNGAGAQDCINLQIYFWCIYSHLLL